VGGRSGCELCLLDSESRRTKGNAVAQNIINRDRQSLILASGPTTGYFGGSIKRACERLLKKLGPDYLDVFQLFWLGRGSAWSTSTVKALISLRESGVVRAIGVSIHNRKRAGQLAEDSPLDMLMIRYNAAHTGAEQDIFPHLSKRKPAVIAYRATRWRGLLKRPSCIHMSILFNHVTS